MNNLYDNESVKFSELIGKKISTVRMYCDNEDNEDMSEINILIFVCNDGTKYKMYHDQDCCEYVYLSEIIGDIHDLVDAYVYDAKVTTNTENHVNHYSDDGSEYCDESYTWTFYNIRTNKGYVTLRWYGSSNGYYSESVNFIKLNNIKDENDDNKN